MAGSFSNPFPQFFNPTPAVYSSGTLNFYVSGTDTPLAVYSDEGLAVSLGTSVDLNAAGRPATQIFLQDLDYKVILKDSSSNTIWTADPVRARDSGLLVKTLTGSGSPNGSVAGTAGSAGVLPDMYWDYTNSYLYVCTTTGTSSTAVWTAINASSSTAAVPPPQGRLTPTSATPVITTGVTSGTAVYYTPYIGNLIPVYNGSTMIPTEFSELTLTLHSSHATNAIYDVFVFSNSGILTVVTGPAWSTPTAGAGARGTGASTTELTRVKGIWVNAVQMTARNGSTTYTVGANLATYVGSIFIDGTAGQITCHAAWGQSRKWAVWNAYNRVPVTLRAGDSTASWTYAVATIRAANASTANSLTIFSGLPETPFFLRGYQGSGSTSNGATAIGLTTGIGYNSTTAATSLAQPWQIGATAASFAISGISYAEYDAPPAIGINVITLLEKAASTSTMTVVGGEDRCMLLATWAA